MDSEDKALLQTVLNEVREGFAAIRDTLAAMQERLDALDKTAERRKAKTEYQARYRAKLKAAADGTTPVKRKRRKKGTRSTPEEVILPPPTVEEAISVAQYYLGAKMASREAVQAWHAECCMAQWRDGKAMPIRNWERHLVNYLKHYELNKAEQDPARIPDARTRNWRFW